MLCTMTQETQNRIPKRRQSFTLTSAKKLIPISSTKTSLQTIPHCPQPNHQATPRLPSTCFAMNRQVTRVIGVLSVLFLMIQRGHAFEFKVGGSQGWTLPSDPTAAIYNHWAQKNRFQIGDSLLFVYSADHDSVLRVTKDDYEKCSVEKPLDKFTDGHSVYKFNQSGPHYFISGVADNCHKNEKLIVVVLADRSNHGGSNGTVGSPPPSPSEDLSPPSPAPSGEESPSPPPSEETNPTPAPSEESSPPKNAVASVAPSAVALFFASSLVLAI